MQPSSGTILLVEDDPIMGESLLQSFEIDGWTAQWSRSGREALAALGARDPDVILCDIRLPDMSGEDVFREAVARKIEAPFLFMTAFGQIDQAVSLVKAGAHDYLTKPFDVDVVLERARWLALRGRRQGSSGDLGISPAMIALEQLCRRIANRPSPILISGETGVGKEVCARFLHMASSRAHSPFMAVNCAAIPADLLESELFGHERGAFSGAHQRHLGYAERAQAGTLFLDEIGELPQSLQAKLLRVLDARTFSRVGGEQELSLRARVICASNRDLAREAASGRFREDLLYRINVVSIEIPPLRSRPEDIPWLMSRVFEGLLDAGGHELAGVSSLAEDAALAYPWPGNVRELRNRMERAVSLAIGEWIMPGDLFPDEPSPIPRDNHTDLALARAAAERRQIERALAENGLHLGKTAKALGISRTTLWEKMRRYEISTH